MTRTITTDEAIALLKQGETADNIILSDIEEQKIAFRDALLLVENGFLVPTGNITYDDADVQYDPDIDDVAWEGKYRKLSEVLAAKGITEEQENARDENILLELAVSDQAVRRWLQENKSELRKLLAKLVVDLYHIDQKLHSK
jgi:hypothetical protein